MSTQSRSKARNAPSIRRIQKILVANRGEVAVRVIRSCRDLGIASVAVYSDADRGAMHVALADEAVHLGPSRAADSYLDARRIMAAVRESGADAVHPGFGFLSENAEFADLVRGAGIVFIGPSSSAIRAMGSKARARSLVRELGIPLVPGEESAEQSPEHMAAAAGRVGFPVMIKAVAGGGGTGIRIVRDASEFAAALASVRQEALAAFGDATVLIERYFERVRHIEVQIVADLHGNVVHCFDRECSIQRRRQKLVEEAPAPGLDAHLRKKLADAAVRIAEAVGYSSLGTVEFLLDEDSGQYYFLEMNTRLQVEHGITEMITGLDLVRWQIEIAEGLPLARRQDEISCRGHAIECRLCAEDPESDFAPATGTVLHWSVESGEHLRIDTGVCAGTEVTAYYDSMLAKLMAWAPDREAAVRSLRGAIGRAEVAGVVTNQRFLARVLDHPQFRAARTSTRFVELHRSALAGSLSPAECRRALLLAALQRWRTQSSGAVAEAGERSYLASVGQVTTPVRIGPKGAHRYHAVIETQSFEIEVLHEQRAPSLLVAIDGHAARHAMLSCGNTVHVSLPGAGSVPVEFQSRFRRAPEPDLAGCYRAAMTGRILQVMVECGNQVRAGDQLLVMESMKMEHVTVAGSDGVVSQLHASPGCVVEKGEVLIEIDVQPSGNDPAVQEA